MVGSIGTNVGTKVLVIKNIERESLGHIEGFLKDNFVLYDVMLAEDGITFPKPEDYDAVIVLGGPDSANDDTTKIINELDFITKIIELQKPYMGICLGMQLLVKAAGGTVFKNDVKEIGSADISGEAYDAELTLAGRYDPLFAGIEEGDNPFSLKLKFFQLHGETVELLSSMECLAAGKYAKNQIVKIGKNAYGIQGHLEADEKMLLRWLEEDDELKNTDKEIVKKQFDAFKDDYYKNAKIIFNNWLRIVKGNT